MHVRTPFFKIAGLLLLLSSRAVAVVGDTWEEIHVSGIPLERQLPVTVAFHGRLWLTGGYTIDCCGYPEDCCGNKTYHDDLLVSDDGFHWTTIYEHAPFGARAGSLVYVFKGKLYIAGGLFSASSSNLWRSANGLDWEPIKDDIYQPSQLIQIAAINNRILVVGEPFFSINGVNWEIDSTWYQYTRPFDTAAIAAAVLNDDVYVYQFAYVDGSAHVWRSLDGYQWTELEGNISGLATDLGAAIMHSFAGYLWLYFPNSYSMWRSSNGEYWEHLHPGNAGDELAVMVDFDEDLFLTGIGGLGRTSATCTELLGTAQTADRTRCGHIGLSELLRVIQFFGTGSFHCDTNGEDGYVPGLASAAEGEGSSEGETLSCMPHASDYAPQDWTISLMELLRLIQLYNAGTYMHCPSPSDSEDGFCISSEGS